MPKRMDTFIAANGDMFRIVAVNQPESVHAKQSQRFVVLDNMEIVQINKLRKVDETTWKEIQ